jgi:hypothetical protein
LVRVEIPADVSLFRVGDFELKLSKYTQSVSYGVPIAIGAFDACNFAYPQILFVFHLHLCHLIHVKVAQ